MHPYETLAENFFWSPAVAKRNMFDISGLWDPKFRIGKRMKVATFGSCFAQHIGRALESSGFNWFVSEPGPQGLSAENAKKFNYGVFSARTGNIYTVSLLKQWVDWAIAGKPVPNEIWEKDGRFYDPFRPNIEPNGFDSGDELVRSRDAAIEAFKTTLTDSQVFVFTLGLTESWFNADEDYEYPMCPGTVAGTFDRERHRFVNQEFPFIRKTMSETIQTIRRVNPKIKFILTVSPVPLTATMSGNHVLVATTESKSILRAVAGSLQRQFDFVDYFPSYEIINTAPYRGIFFEANQRHINQVGVNHVMSTFFSCLVTKFSSDEGNEKTVLGSRRRQDVLGHGRQEQKAMRPSQEDIVCEEALLDAFSK